MRRLRASLTAAAGGALLVSPLAAAPRDYRGPVIDVHAHIRLTEAEGTATADHAVGTGALERLDRSAGVASSALIVMAERGKPSETRQKNDAVIAAAASGTRFFPVASVHPLDGAAAIAELDRVAKLGVRIVKLHPNTQDFDVADPAVGIVADRAGKLGVILLFDSYKPWDVSEMGKLIRLGLEHPDTKLILAHMGFSAFRETMTLKVIANLGAGKNIWFDLAAIAPTYADFPVEPELVWTMRQLGMQRFLFGSDWPVYTPAVALDAVRRLGLTAAEQKLVLHDNAARLLDSKSGGAD